MKYLVWCTKYHDFEVEAESTDEAIAKAKKLCDFIPDLIEVCDPENEKESEEEENG